MRSPILHSVIAAVALAFVCSSARADHPSAGFGHGVAGPIVTIPAGTLPAHAWAIGVRTEWVEFDPFSDARLEEAALADEEIHSLDRLLSPSIAFAYGLTPDLSLGARLPYVARFEIREGHLEEGVPEVHSHGDSKGIGDITVLGQYRFAGRAEHGEAALESSLLLGLKLPTGNTTVETAAGDRLEVEHQPGTGSLDPLVGLAVSKPLGKASLDANILGTFPAEGDENTRLGTLVDINAALSYRPGAGAEHAHEAGAEPHEHLALDLVLELNGEWRQPTEIDGVEQENTGGALIYLAPGLRYGLGSAWSLSGSLGIPIMQDLDGTQHETRLRGLFGLGLSF